MDKNIHGKLRQLAALLNCSWKWCEECCGSGLASPGYGDLISECKTCCGSGERLTPKEIK